MFSQDFSDLLGYVDTTSAELVALANIHRGSTIKETTKITFNSVKHKFTYVSERKDRWQKPMETLARGLGDCEDLSIFFASLLAIDNISNWLLVVKNSQWVQFHVLNAVETDEKEIMLLDVSIKQEFDSKPFYQDNVLIYGFHPVFKSATPFIPYMFPIPLNLFMGLNSSLRNNNPIPLAGN